MSTVREPPGRLFLRFLRFGALAWGGPVAQIAMIREELVEEERWVDRRQFNRILGVYQALPGPEAHELCVYFGRMAGGTTGGILAGLGFMLPGFLLMLGLAWAYVHVGLEVAALAGVFAGLQAAVVALIARGLLRIGRHALVSPWLWAIGAAALAASLAGVHFALVLAAAGTVGVSARRPVVAMLIVTATAAAVMLLPALRPVEPVIAAVEGGPLVVRASLVTLLGAGLAAGLLTFGGAYTAIPILQQEAVGTGGWMTQSQFLDGIALGGILPAPLIIFATFVGYVGAGMAGALVMTAAVFAPAFVITLVGYRQLERLVAEPRLHAFFDGVTAGVVGLIAATTVRLVPTAIPDVVPAVVAAGAFAVLLGWRRRTAVLWVMLAAGTVGALLLRPAL